MAVTYLAGSIATLFKVAVADYAVPYAYNSGTSGTNRALVISVAHENAGGAPSAVTYGGTSLALARTLVINSPDAFSETVTIWTLANPATGLNNVVITKANSGVDGVATASVYTGVNQAAPVGNTAVNSALAGTQATTVSITKQAAENLIFWAHAHDRSGRTVEAVADNVLLAQGDTDPGTSSGTSFGVGYRVLGSGPVLVGATQIGGGYEDNGIAAIELLPASLVDYTQRKGSTFDATHTLGTITTATLNAVNVFDHVSSQAAGTVSFTGAITDERTTSGVVDLVLGDGAATQTQTVQVNVFGVVPSNNPAQKDGSALASLTGVQIRITAGANLNGTQVYYSGTETTNASGNFSTLDVSTSAAVAADPVRMQVLTAAGDSITSAETVELI
jgi:hypothetical protein